MPFLIRELHPATLLFQRSWRGKGSPTGHWVIKEYLAVMRKESLPGTTHGIKKAGLCTETEQSFLIPKWGHYYK